MKINAVQTHLHSLKLVLHVHKTKAELLKTFRDPSVTTAPVAQTEFVNNYKYLGFILDKEISFKKHIENLLQTVKTKIWFYYRHGSSFSVKTFISNVLLSPGRWRSFT